MRVLKCEHLTSVKQAFTSLTISPVSSDLNIVIINYDLNKLKSL